MSLSKFVFLVAATSAGAAITQSYVTTRLVPAINNLIKTYPPNDRQDVPESQAPYPLNGGILRLAFHDCAGAGGCDGCVGLSLEENKGLDYPVKALESLYSSLKLKDAGVSRADLWALAGQVVVGNRMRFNQTSSWILPAKLDPKNFKYGRKDCATAPLAPADQPSDFPGAFFGPSQVAGYFALRFTYDAKQTVAIMGAHHVGRMHQRNSGFKGAWLPDENMDGEYYSNMVTLTDWHQEVVNCSVTPYKQKVSWEANSDNPNSGGHPGSSSFSTSTSGCSECKEYYNLDADVAIYKDFGIPKFNGAVECTFSSCPYAATLSDYTKLYASNGRLFQEDFAVVFDIMQSVCTRQSSGSPNWCTLTSVATVKSASAPEAIATSESTTEGSGNSALYALFAIPGLVLVAGVVGFGVYRRKSSALVELQDVGSLINEEPKQTVTPAEGLRTSNSDTIAEQAISLSLTGGSL